AVGYRRRRGAWEEDGQCWLAERRSENRWSRRLKPDIADQKDSGAEVNPSGVQTRGSPQTSTKSSCRRPTAISDRGGGQPLHGHHVGPSRRRWARNAEADASFQT
ncbi:unnamed protein product, partial [Ixodes persulcatus]